MKEISLSKGMVAIVDDEDFEWLSKWRWRFTDKGYAERTSSVNGIQKTISMHSEIVSAPKGMMTDHINRDRLDNRRSNLRVCTRSQNRINSKLDHDSTSGFKGVTWNKKVGKWTAHIKKDGKNHWGGCFIDKHSAARAYDKLAKEVYGEFAPCNFPGDKS